MGNIGPFICALRKESRMTQKELAERLGITDKAVSKWERGLSCPDISLLPSLAEALGVTVAELLDGARSAPPPDRRAGAGPVPDGAGRPDGRARSWRSALALSFSALLMLAALVCSICDRAANGRATWSLYPISSLVFAWFVLFPTVRSGARGIPVSLLSLSVLLLPFLYVLDCLLPAQRSILPAAVKISALSLLFAWSVFFTLKNLKSRPYLAAGIVLLLAACLHFAIQLVLP